MNSLSPLLAEFFAHADDEGISQRSRMSRWSLRAAMGYKLPFAAHIINNCNWCKWTSRRSILSIEKSCFRGEMRLPFSLVFFPCSGINFPCSLINRETGCKALLLWYDSEPNQQKTANIDPKRTFFPVNRENAVRLASSRLSALPNL